MAEGCASPSDIYFTHRTRAPLLPILLTSCICICSVEQEVLSVGYNEIVLPHGVGDHNIGTLEKASIRCLTQLIDEFLHPPH